MLAVKKPTCQCKRHKRCRFDPWVRKIPWRRACKPLHFSCLENPIDRGAWRATVHRIAKSVTWLKWLSMWHSYLVVRGLTSVLLLALTQPKLLRIFFFTLFFENLGFSCFKRLFIETHSKCNDLCWVLQHLQHYAAIYIYIYLLQFLSFEACKCSCFPVMSAYQHMLFTFKMILNPLLWHQHMNFIRCHDLLKRLFWET